MWLSARPAPGTRPPGLLMDTGPTAQGQQHTGCQAQLAWAPPTRLLPCSGPRPPVLGSPATHGLDVVPPLQPAPTLSYSDPVIFGAGGDATGRGAAQWGGESAQGGGLDHEGRVFLWLLLNVRLRWAQSRILRGQEALQELGGLGIAGG